LHKPGYVQSDDPGAVGAGILWIDTTETYWVAKIRNDADDGWETINVDINGTGDLAAPAVADEILLSDTSDSNTVKKSDLDAILALYDSKTSTLTNKTFDANGTGNSLSNVDVADLANGTDGELITWAADATPTTVATGTDGQVLTSNGAGSAPTFQDAPAGGDTTHMAQDMQELTDGANISWDMDSGGFAYVTLGGNRTLDNPSNVSAGGLYRLKVTQDGTGSRTLSYGSNFKFAGGTDPVLSSGAGDVDMLEFIAYDSSTLYLVNFVADLQ
jgi:hypothetical protein